MSHTIVNAKPSHMRPVQLIALIGLGALAGSLWAASIHLNPDTSLRMRKGITPLLSAELVRNKADLEQIFGAPNSENRRVIKDALAFDFITCWLWFGLFLCSLIINTRPKLRRVVTVTMLMIMATGIARYAASRRLFAAADATVFTDAMAWEIRWPYLLTWLLLFAFSILTSLVFLGGRSEAKVGGYIFILSSLIGILGIVFYDVLIAYAALGLFVGLCGVTIILLLSPQSV